MSNDFVEGLAKKWCQRHHIHNRQPWDDYAGCNCLILASAIREALEGAEKLACKYCQTEKRMDPARPWTHHAIDFSPGSRGVVYAACRAAAIAALRR